jgi:hypothetical protein
MWPNFSMEICGKNFKFFYYIDFEIIAFEGRRKCFFGPCLAESAGFDSPLHEKLELNKAKLLEIHNV